MEMNLGVVKEKVVKLELDEKGFAECRCKELEQRCRKAEARCLELELELGKTKREKETLEIIVEKLAIEDELKIMKKENREKVDLGGGVDLNEKREDELRVLKPVIEDNSESMEKVANLEVKGSLQEAGAPYIDRPDEPFASTKNKKSEFSTALSTSANAVLSPCEVDQTLVREKKTQSHGEQHCGETVDRFKENVPVSSSSKKRRLTNVTSDIDDNSPISKLTKMHHLEVIPKEECSELKDCSLIPTPTGIDNVTSNKTPWLKEHEEKDKKENCTSKEVEDEDAEELGLDSSSDSLEDDSSSSDSEDFEFVEIISSGKRNKNGQSKWNFEGEGQMLAAFSRDNVLCLKAVCALYRQRVFNLCDASRGTTLAKFLTEGHPQNDVKKSVKELQEYDREGVNVCRKFAVRYSSQLFKIYEKKEDPYFLVTNVPTANSTRHNLILTAPATSGKITPQPQPPDTNHYVIEKKAVPHFLVSTAENVPTGNGLIMTSSTTAQPLPATTPKCCEVQKNPDFLVSLAKTVPTSNSTSKTIDTADAISSITPPPAATTQNHYDTEKKENPQFLVSTVTNTPTANSATIQPPVTTPNQIEKKEDPHFLVSPVKTANSTSSNTTTAQARRAAANHQRYEEQKRRDWHTFCHYLRNHLPHVSISMISGAHVIEFLRYLDKFGKTKVHNETCPHFGVPNSPASCSCPLRQAWGSLDAMAGRLRAAYEEHVGKAGGNPFGAGAVKNYLLEVRDFQAYARGVSYEKKRKPPVQKVTPPTPAST